MSSISLPGHAAFVLWAQVALLLIVARVFGAGVRRVGQPDIAGSLLAGVVLGPSVLGHIWPQAVHWLVPRDDPGELHMLGAVTGFALLALLIVLGAEVDTGLLRAQGRAAVAVTTGSIVVPAAATIVVVWLVASRVSPSAPSSVNVALAVGGALSVSSLPVVARILIELRLGRRTAGQLSIAAGSINDVYGFLLLIPITVIAGSGGLVRVLLPVIGLVVLTVLVVAFGQRIVDALLRRVRVRGPNVAGALTVSFAIAFSLAAVAQGVHVDAALGAFVAGVVLGRSRFQHGPAMQTLETYTTAIFAPLYFASAGLQMDLTTVASGPVFGTLVVVFVIAVVSKFAGSLLGAVAARRPVREGSAIGVALNGRGAMQVIIGTAALRLGAIDEQGFTILLVISLASSLSVAPLLRRLTGGWAGTEEERQRLEHEEQLAENVIVKGQRMLLPTRGGANARAAALVFDRAWPPDAELTLLTIEQDQRPIGTVDVDGLGERPLRRLSVGHGSVVDAILAEANLGYGVIGVGTVEDPVGGRVLPPGIADLLKRSPLPLLLVRRARGEAPTGEFQRIVVAVNGTLESRAAQEVAHGLGRSSDAEVQLLHVTTRPEHRNEGTLTRRLNERRATAEAATAVLTEAVGVAVRHGIEASTFNRRGTTAGDEVVRHVQAADADAVVVGTTVRLVGGRLFLGHTVEHLLERCDGTTVIVVVMRGQNADPLA